MLIPIWVSKHKSTILHSLYSLLLLELFLNWKSRMIFFPFFSFWLLSSYQRAVQHRGPVGQPVPRMHSAMTSTLASIQVAQRPSHPLTKLKFLCVCVFSNVGAVERQRCSNGQRIADSRARTTTHKTIQTIWMRGGKRSRRARAASLTYIDTVTLQPTGNVSVRFYIPRWDRSIYTKLVRLKF